MFVLRFPYRYYFTDTNTVVVQVQSWKIPRGANKEEWVRDIKCAARYRMLDELINGGEIVEISKRAIYK